MSVLSSDGFFFVSISLRVHFLTFLDNLSHGEGLSSGTNAVIFAYRCDHSYDALIYYFNFRSVRGICDILNIVGDLPRSITDSL